MNIYFRFYRRFQYCVELTRLFPMLVVLFCSPLHAQPDKLKIISADLGTTQLLEALQLQNAIVAVDVTTAHRDGYRSLPNVGYHRQLSPEGLLSLDASVLIGSDHMAPRRALEVLERSGVRVLQYKAPYTAEQLVFNIQRLSAELSISSHGDALSKRVNDQLTTLSQRRLPFSSAIFLLEMGEHTRIAGTNTGGDAFLKLLGLSNVAQFENYRDTSVEALLKLRPDIIITGGRGAALSVSATERQGSFALLESMSVQITMDASTLVAGLSLGAIDEASRLHTQLLNTAAHASKN